jgi:hypothetical protein
MTIIELIQSDGFFTKGVGATGGGEYAGPCPWCGGKDRFRCWPNQGEAGKYWCRGCGRSGDAIQYLRDYRRLTYPEACQFLGREPIRSTLAGTWPPDRPAWEPRAASFPGDLWRAKARRLTEEAARNLSTPVGQAARAFLEDRGLTRETVQGFRLGWVAADRYEPPAAWGLAATLKDNGKPRQLWIPKGLTIPLVAGDQVMRVRIRRPEGDPRYYIVRGSSMRAVVLGDGQEVAAVVESELDALLLYQEAGDLVNVVALGNAQARPDQDAANFLSRSRLILVVLDADQAGARESWHWWKDHYHQAHRWPPIQGKDPGEMWAAGVDLRAWVQAGLMEYGENQ